MTEQTATVSSVPEAESIRRAPKLREHGHGRSPWWLRSTATLVSLLSLLPLLFIALVTWQSGWNAIDQLIFRPRVAELLINTALLTVFTVPLCMILGVALAWLTERTDLPGRRLWSLLAIAPLAIPAFVHSYAWIGLFPGIHGLGAAVLLAVIAYSPFMYLPAAAAMRRLDPGIEDVAASLGLKPWLVFLRVVLPQLRLALSGGALLVGLHLLAEYGLFAMVRFDTFTTAIFDQFQSTFSGPAANMLAGVLALCCLAWLAGESASRGQARYARLGAGSPRLYTPVPLKLPARMMGIVLMLIMTTLSLGVPLWTLGRWLWLGGLDAWRWNDLLPALSQTMILAGLGAILTTLAAIPIAWLSVRAPGRFQKILEGINYVASSLPGIVVALALVTICIHYTRPLYQTVFTVLLAYLLMFLPRALVSLRVSIAQVPQELENAARSLGRSPLAALCATTLRLAAPGAASSATLVFLAISNELTATLLLAPNGTRTLATGFWALTSEIDYVIAAPYALIMILLSLPLTGILYYQSKRTSGR
nr:iron ABC transporter permease [uncultured Tolumonas sp.]